MKRVIRSSYRQDASMVEICDWLRDHRTAYSDICRYFDLDENDYIEDYLTLDQVLDWISDHKQLSSDLADRFGINV